jgi:hypothetical protein
VGAKATMSGLQKVHKYGLAFDSFFRQEYIPLLEAGFRTPMLAGFDLFLNAPQIKEAVHSYYTEQATQGKSDPYDTHPSLKERIAALQNLPAGVSHNEREALILLPASIESLVDILLKDMVTQEEVYRNLKPISWDEAVSQVFLPHWEKSAEPYGAILKNLTPSMLFETAQNVPSLFERMVKLGNFLPSHIQPAQVPVDRQLEVANKLIGSALVSALKREGWSVKANPGEAVTCVKGKQELKPFLLFSDLVSRQTSAEQWQMLCEENQISGLALA